MAEKYEECAGSMLPEGTTGQYTVKERTYGFRQVQKMNQKQETLSQDEIKYISRKMSYALRHNPDKYGITLDEEGYTDLAGFLKAMNAMHHFNPPLTRQTIQYVMDHSDKKRFEMTDARIRALYGHSVMTPIIKEEAEPPEVLYHGTARRFLDSIMERGLQPMRRQYVHLSVDRETAVQTGLRKDPSPAVLVVDARRAYQDGVRFYIGSDRVWLSDPIPPEYLKFPKQ